MVLGDNRLHAFQAERFPSHAQQVLHQFRAIAMAPTVRGQHIAQLRSAWVAALYIRRRGGDYQPAQAGEAAGAPHFHHQFIHSALSRFLRF
jgi:hypothetical protein